MDRYDPYTDKFLRDTQYNIHCTDLAEVGTDLISRQDAIDALKNVIVVEKIHAESRGYMKTMQSKLLSSCRPHNQKSYGAGIVSLQVVTVGFV